VGIGILTDQRMHLNTLAANALGHIAKNAEGSDDVEGFCRRTSDQADEEKKAKACQTVKAAFGKIFHAHQ
jgi:hypothetical protein